MIIRPIAAGVKRGSVGARFRGPDRLAGFAATIQRHRQHEAALAERFKIPLDLLHQVTDEIGAAHLNMLRAGPAGHGEA